MYVEFKSGLGPSEPCNDGTSNECFHLATTFPNLDGRTVLTLWEKGNIPPYGHIGTIDWANFARLDWLLKHELGHVLGLHHESADACRGSVMIGDQGVVLEQGEGRVLPAHCYTLQNIHEPADPFEEIRGLDPIETCRSLLGYCDGWIPWPKQRSRCVYYPDVITIVETTDPSGGSLGRHVIQRYRMECVSSGWGWRPDGDQPEGWEPPFSMEVINAPNVAITLPNDDAVAESGMLWVAGWAWANSNPIRQLAFWVDGVEVSSAGITTGIYRPELCQAGVDPGNCDPNSGFEGHLNVSGFTPGRHYLQVVVTDQYPDLMPSYLQIPFIVPSSAPNLPPIAVNDTAVASVGAGGTTTPKAIPVVNNDHDPEGWPLRLSEVPFVTWPTKGTVRRLDDRTIEYTPLPSASGTDSFQYKVEDSFGMPATATVTISIFQIHIIIN